MKVQESMEDYLETIYVLEKQTGYVRSIDIATALGFSKPSISNAMKKLKTNGYIEMEERGCIKLTEKGKALAMGTFERHCVISEILMGFGVSKEAALEDACRIEHVISEETFTGMKNFIKLNRTK
ncbi:MAG: metal-dependent transcriptional regulator [Clostridia bacterium]|nr:metal-dependent transcriptional regulator [Clostridia bacterium]